MAFFCFFKALRTTFFLLLAILFLSQKYLFLSVYALTSAVYCSFLRDLFPSWNEEKLFQNHKAVEDLKYEIEFGLPQLFILILLIGISFSYQIVFGKLYLLIILLSLLFRIFSVSLERSFLYLIAKVKQLKKDKLTMQYHWFVDFRVFKDLVYINLISLCTYVIMLILVQLFFFVSEETIKHNFYHGFISFILHYVMCFAIDIYIVLFANMPIAEKMALLYQKCVAASCIGSYVNY